MINSVSGHGLLETDLSFISDLRSGMSNDGAAMMMQYNANMANEVQDADDDSNVDSILNSHRRSRSQSMLY